MRKRVVKRILSRRVKGSSAVLGCLLAAGGAGLAQSALQFTLVNYSVNEAAEAVTLTVERLNDPNTAVSVDYATADGTATSGVKYTATNGTLVFAGGETNKAIVVPILNDGLADGTKTFQVVLSNPAGGAVLGTRTNATVSVADNDSGVEFRFPSYPPPAPINNYPPLTESSGAVVVGIVRRDDGNQTITVDLATSDLTATNGVDYVGVTTNISFVPPERLMFVSIPILNNNLKQSNRRFRVTLSNPIGGILGSTRITTVTIADDDQGFQFESASYSVAEDGGAALIRVLRGTDETTPLATVDVVTLDSTAMAGLDYTGTTNTLSFAPGESVKLIAIPLLNDGLRESTETFRVALSNPTGGAVLGPSPTTTVTILDNDPGLGFDLASYAVWEKAGEITLTVVRGNDADLRPFTVDYATSDGTATAGQDYQANSGTLQFLENETVKSLTIAILGDSAAEGIQTFRVTLSNPGNGATLGVGTAFVNINDNYCTVAPPFDSRLAIRREGEANSLTWSGGGKLQRADRVTGPWQTLSATKGPYGVQSPVPASFYRVSGPRPVNLYVPSSYDGQAAMPLVILLHGGGYTGQQGEGWVQFRALAETRGFLYCYPDGTPFLAVSGFGWNGSDVLSDPATDWGGTIVDDAGYLRDLVQEIGQRFAMDRKRVYFIGHSIGGNMAYRMACQFADLVAGIASVAGPLSLDPRQCSPSEPVSILHIHGTADTAALYWGGFGVSGVGNWINPTPNHGAVRTIQTWAGYNGASGPITDPTPSLDLVLDVAGPDTLITRYTNAPPGGAVELWTINNGPHTPDLSSEFRSRVIDWLLSHPKP